MSPPIRFSIKVALVILIYQFNFVKGEGCHSATNPIRNDYFQISCQKSPLRITIQCYEIDKWEFFPRTNLSLKSINKLIIKDCSLPPELSLFNFTDSLLKIAQIEKVEFRNLSSSPTQEFFDNFTTILKEVAIYDQNFLELPDDLFRKVDVESFMVRETGLTSIPDNFFINSLNPTNLEDLDIIKNKLTKLRRNDFAALDKLKHLWLFENEISEIEQHTFDNLTDLQLLELSSNKLKTLPSQIFKRLINLELLNLSENEFNFLPADLLRKNSSKLRKVRLNHNRGDLASIPSGFFKNLRSLNTVELVGNNFTSLPADAFLGANSLETLNLNYNNLITLPVGLFESTSKLQVLSVAFNNLTWLPDGIFEDADLRNLTLDHNQLTNITSNLLLGLEDLMELKASSNNLSLITKDFCIYMQHLKQFDFSYNNLSLKLDRFGYSIFVNCSFLEKVDLAYNQIVKIPNDWYHNAVLQDVNYEGNIITELMIDDFFPLNNGSVTNVKKNKIHTIYLDYEKTKNFSIKNLKSPEILLDENPLNCTCNLLGLSRYFRSKLVSGDVDLKLDIKADNLECHNPPKYKNWNFKTIQPEELSCFQKSVMLNDACNNTCSCWNYPGKRLLLVDCSNRNLTKIPQHVANPNNWSIALNMSGNILRETPELNQSYLLNVTHLDLSCNNISLVSVKVFSKVLQILKLHNNRITRLDNTVIAALTSNTVLYKLTLYKNKWECTCETRNFLKFIKKKMSNATFFGSSSPEIICERTGLSLYTMSSNELCDTTKKMVQLVVLISLMIAFFGLILGVLAALYYKYENEIKIWLYAKRWCMWLITEDEVDKNKKFDAFISFSHKDEDFVEKEIIPKLEEGPNPFKLCLHHRDWLAGEWIPEQIARSVEESRRTIIILSPNFLESVWGRLEFRAAQTQAREENRIRVIIILYGEIGNVEDLDSELKAYMNMNTYIKWGDPWFWDKLRYALPHKYEPKKRKSTNARAQLIEMHLAQTKYNRESGKADVTPVPNINESSNDSTKLLDSTTEDDRICP